MTAPVSTAKLSDPVKPTEMARFLGVSLGTVYESMRRHSAAVIAGDAAAASRFIPCIHMGGRPQPDGTVKGGRYIVSREAFRRWYRAAGGAS